jgi:hypothetical protein
MREYPTSHVHLHDFVSKCNVGYSLMFLYVNLCLSVMLGILSCSFTLIKVKEQLVVRPDIDVNEHERIPNITLTHKLK